ncbi:DUF4974 domain-containing protein [Pedobacter sp. BS3]|uniref:FecR family protein n=1 Tax=Pedobacter sp. BS3 TaxID=2567937 RepID=UPI0011EF1134|nr:FecR family protein [Pedobacter sp. BS3]TZF82989.1 DUF4974 domain-containing protein [Pedobacter sp. BS3]
MDTQQERFTFLLDRYLKKASTLDELREFFSLLKQQRFRDEFEAAMKNGFDAAVPCAEVHAVDWDEMYASIISQPHKTVKPVWGNWARVAAVLLVICATSIVLWRVRQNTGPVKKDMASVQTDIEPSNKKAILRLDNGQTIMLDGKGVLESRGGNKVRKTALGIQLYFDNTADNKLAEVHTVTLTTATGGQYMLILPDNSKVWLNANSSISFPSAFTGNERDVEVRGEAYFEVSKDKEHPFRVKSGNSTVTVLGTHFNVMTYDDEPRSEVALAEGSVRLDLGTSSCVLKPGQQASFSNRSDHIRISPVSIEDIAGWKDGLFQFDNTPVTQVMRQLQRWYDVKVAYEGGQPDIAITAMISKTNKISKILDLLTESSGLTFEVKNKIVTVKSQARREAGMKK